VWKNGKNLTLLSALCFLTVQGAFIRAKNWILIVDYFSGTIIHKYATHVIELPEKLLDYFLQSNKNNINQRE